MSKLKVDEIRSADRSVSSSANITLADDGNIGIGKTPAAKLDIKCKADNANDGAFSIEANSNTNRLFQLGETTSQTAIQQMYSGNTEKVRLHANGDTFFNGGDVGIGTSSPANNLEIGAYSGDKTLCLTSSANGNTFIRMNDGDSSEGMFIKTTGAASIPAMKMSIGRNWGGDTDLVTILGDGKVGIGTSAPGTVLEVKSPSGVSSWGVFNTAGNSSAGVRFQREAAQKWWIYNNHGQSDRLQISDAADNNGFWLAQDTSTWSGFSDERMKKDWVIFSDALTKINKLTKIGEFRKINPITGEYVSDVTQRGLSAQEVEKILPEAVTKSRRNIEIYPDDDTEYLGLAYQDVFVLAIKAIQELSAKVTALENK